MTRHNRPERERMSAPSTPRDVVHIRLGSFVLVFAVALGTLGLVAGLPLLTAVTAVVAVGAIVDIVFAVRRQAAREREGDGSAGFE
ncbi:hypothetical protein HNP84_002059 [Thermocatellispora tengchongensis]|uniref:Uncharacterized protein n=1 Tax=Thermocatellispora tengchongensis TaxID=1073253 RepID=A0A840P364_9ACTN|nr:hypothetical protein [Thermocatellispora tengchongensis]MBB5132343.1 hypothetical protein [Thermocatellispora tengchongensis]